MKRKVWRLTRLSNGTRRMKGKLPSCLKSVPVVYLVSESSYLCHFDVYVHVTK